jgi:hypothetical protein
MLFYYYSPIILETLRLEGKAIVIALWALLVGLLGELVCSTGISFLGGVYL